MKNNIFTIISVFDYRDILKEKGLIICENKPCETKIKIESLDDLNKLASFGKFEIDLKEGIIYIDDELTPEKSEEQDAINEMFKAYWNSLDFKEAMQKSGLDEEAFLNSEEYWDAFMLFEQKYNKE